MTYRSGPIARLQLPFLLGRATRAIPCSRPVRSTPLLSVAVRAGAGLVVALCFVGGETAAAQGAESGAAVVFTKDFPGSSPAYYSISVRESGETIYRAEQNDEAPVEFRLPADVVSEIFSQARKLSRFQNVTLESKRRVANMGKKTFEYRDGAENSAASFNHTELPEAVALTALFERISNTQQHSLRLQNLIRFDRLGVVKALLQLEIDLDQGRLLDPTQLVPVLERIQKDRALVQVAQGRAAQILAKIQAASPKLPSAERIN